MLKFVKLMVRFTWYNFNVKVVIIDGEVHHDTTLMLKFVSYWWWDSLDTTLMLKLYQVIHGQ